MKKKEYCSIGIMSGTSIDGLDFSLIKTDGINNIQNLNNKFYRFNLHFRNNIKKLVKSINKKNYKEILKSKEYLLLNKNFTIFLSKKIDYFFKSNSIKKSSVDVLGFHGNTIIHEPSIGLSIQLGDPIFLAKLLKIKIITNFRNKDIDNQGQGAPLVPVFHKYLFAESNENVMVVNIGGISNFTFLEGKNKFFASDIGPGNKLIDEFCYKNFGKLFDKNGFLSAKGSILPDLIEVWKKKSFVTQKHPNSFDSEFFKLKEFTDNYNFNSFDLLRSLTFFSAYLIFNNKNKIKKKINKWIFCGGGTANSTLMNDLKKLLGKSKVYISDHFHFDPFFIESQAFAYIAVRTLQNLPSSFPETTGCLTKTVCGEIY